MEPTPDKALESLLERYGALVLEANRRVNLTAAKSAPEISEHILDSLSVVPFLREPYVDVGSGGGFPAIPAALATGIGVTMIEATAKKARILASFCERLGIRATIVAERAETAAHRPDLREQFASGTARAVAAPAAAAELLLPLVAVGGVAILQLGLSDDEDRTALEGACLMLGGRIESESAAGERRRVVLVHKIEPTQQRFPRRPGIPAKRPLCAAGPRKTAEVPGVSR